MSKIFPELFGNLQNFGFSCIFSGLFCMCIIIIDTFLFNSKSTNPSTEVSFINYTNYPLIPEIQETTANASNLIEHDVADGWIRGGISCIYI